MRRRRRREEGKKKKTNNQQQQPDSHVPIKNYEIVKKKKVSRERIGFIIVY